MATPCAEVWQTSSLRPLRLGEEKKTEEEEETQDKNIMSASVCRAAITKFIVKSA